MADPRARIIIDADDRASRALRRVKGELTGVSRAASALSRISLGGALSVGGLTALATRSIETADAIGKTADKLGLGVEALQEYRFAAEQSGVSTQQFDTAIQRLGRRLAEADNGSGEAVKAFEELGIATKNANGQLKTIDEILPELADAFGKVENQIDRTRLAQKLFDSEGVGLVNLLREGSAGLEEFRNRAREAGLVISEDLVRGAEAANDELNVFNKVISTQITASLLNLAPIITSITSGFVELTQSVREFISVSPDIKNAGGTELDILNRRLDTLVGELDNLERREKRVTEIKVFGDSLEKIAEERNAIDLEIEQIQRRIVDIKKAKEELAKVIVSQTSPQLPAAQPDTKTQSRITRDCCPSDKQAKAQKELTIKIGETIEQKERLLLLERTLDEVDPARPLIRQLEALEELERLYPEYAATIGIAILQVEEDIERVNSGLEEQADQVEEVQNQWIGFGDIAVSALEDAILESKKFSDILDGLEKDILRLVTRNLVTEPLAQSIGGFFQGSSSGGGNIFSSLFGAARGADFMVGGGGGTDSQVVAFRATPGEQVTVRTPQQQRNANSVTININGVNNPDDFRRSMPQLQREARRLIAGV